MAAVHDRCEAERRVSDYLEIETDRERIAATVVVNAAGLYADLVSEMLGGEAFTIYPAAASTPSWSPHRRGLIRGLIYPVPHLPGHSLGVHPRPDGRRRRARGPTIRYQSGRADYESDRLDVEDFVAATASMLRASRPRI
jgi:L-2-hydroxyglutarate oxidase LhgO